MDEWDPAEYGRRWAADYDELHAEPLHAPYGQVDETVALLADLADGGRALELGIGTGRIALPLAARGVDVSGVDISADMVAQLRAKPGGADIPVAIGDMADVPFEGPFSVIYVVFATFFGLTERSEQLRCLRNVAARLIDDGVFVLQAFVPDPAKLVPIRQTPLVVTPKRSVWDVASVDLAEQRITSHRIAFDVGGGVDVRPIVLRYVWPSELDLMAELAGLRLRQRWADWRGAPFTSASGSHVSVYERVR